MTTTSTQHGVMERVLVDMAAKGLLAYPESQGHLTHSKPATFGIQRENRMVLSLLQADFICGKALVRLQRLGLNRDFICREIAVDPGQKPVGLIIGMMQFFIPFFCQFGKDYKGARDNFVYTYAPERKSSKWEVQKPGEISLWRVPRTHIMDRRNYEFFAGLNRNGKPIWTRTLAFRRPVFRDTVNGIFNTSVSYNPGIGRYLLITEHTSFAHSNLGIYDAPEPWGPWTTVAFETKWGFPTIPGNTFYWNFSNKWLSSDGKDFVLIFSGIGIHDACNMLKGKFVLGKNKD